MKENKGFERLWAGCDNLLLVTVFVLLGAVWYSANRTDALLGGASAAGAGRDETRMRRPVSPSLAVEGLRVSAGRTRVNTIARSMVASGWERVPCSPAMDMREDGKAYEVLFSLPEWVAQESVRVTAAGNVLTLTMRDGDTGKTYQQRVRIPCLYDAERADHVLSAISNDVLRVRIQPPAG